MDFITYIASIPTLEEMEERKTFCFLWSVLNREKNGNRSPIILYIFPFSMAPGKISLIVLKFLYFIEWHLNFGNRPGNLGDHRGGGRAPNRMCDSPYPNRARAKWPFRFLLKPNHFF